MDLTAGDPDKGIMRLIESQVGQHRIGIRARAGAWTWAGLCAGNFQVSKAADRRGHAGIGSRDPDSRPILIGIATRYRSGGVDFSYRWIAARPAYLGSHFPDSCPSLSPIGTFLQPGLRLGRSVADDRRRRHRHLQPVDCLHRNVGHAQQRIRAAGIGPPGRHRDGCLQIAVSVAGIHAFRDVLVHDGSRWIAAGPVGQLCRQPGFPVEAIRVSRIAIEMERRRIGLPAIGGNAGFFRFHRHPIVNRIDVLATVERELLQIHKAFQIIGCIVDPDTALDRSGGLIVRDRIDHERSVPRT